MIRNGRFAGLGAGLLVLLLLVSGGAAIAAPGDGLTLDQWRSYQDELLKAGEKDRALDEFRKRVAKEESALNRYLLGRVYGKTRQLEKAKAEFARALELDPLYGPACQGLAVCLVATGELDRATEELRRAIRLDKNDLESRVMLAGLLAERGKVAEGESMLRGILRDDPKRIDARFLLARLLLQTKRPDKAYLEFEAVLYLEKGHAGAQRGLAVSAMMIQKWGVAEAQLRSILKQWPKDVESALWLVQVLAQTARGIEDPKSKKARFDEAFAILDRLEVAGPSEALKKAIMEERKLVQALQSGSGRPAARSIGEYVVKLIERLDSEDVEVRRKTMKALMKFEFRRVPAPIVKHVTDPDVTVRVLVLRMIGGAGEDTSIPLLAVKLRHPTDADENFLVRGACVDALAKIQSAAAIPVLLVALEDESDYVVESAIRALRRRCGVRFGGDDIPAAIETDRKKLQQGWWRWWRSPRAVAQKARAIEGMRSLFGRTKSRTLLSYLVPLLEDGDPAIFDAAYAVLVEAGGKSFGEAKDADARQRIAREAREWVKAGRK